MLSTKRQQRLLTFGYIRLYSIKQIPNELILLLLQFYDDVMHFHFEGDKLSKFLSIKNGDAHYTQSFIIKERYSKCIKITISQYNTYMLFIKGPHNN